MQYILVPSHFTKDLLNTSFFSEASRFHVNKKQRNFLIENKLAEWLDRPNRILRRTPLFETALASETGAGMVHLSISNRLRWLMTAEMHRGELA